METHDLLHPTSNRCLHIVVLNLGAEGEESFADRLNGRHLMAAEDHHLRDTLRMLMISPTR